MLHQKAASTSVRLIARSALLVSALIGLLGLTSCDPPGGAQPERFGFDPCCALVVADNPPGQYTSRLLISQRRGAPADDQWEILGDHHNPQTTDEIPVGSPEFKWYYLQDVKEVAVPLGGDRYQVHVLVATMLKDSRGFLEGGLFVDVIQKADKLWRAPRVSLGPDRLVPTGRPDGPLGTDVGRTGRFNRISGTAVDGKLHVCTVESQGQLERTVYDPTTDRFDGWTDVEMSGALEVGDFVDVGCAGVLNPSTGVEQLHVCGVTADGELWHSVETAPRIFSPFAKVKLQAGDVGSFNRVDCAGNRGQLHLVGVAGKRAWYTAMGAGGWRAFEDVAAEAPADPTPGSGAGFGDVAIGFCNDGVPPDGPHDVSQLNVVLPESYWVGPGASYDHIWHTIRATNPIAWSAGSDAKHWRPMRDLGRQINYRNGPPQSNVLHWAGFSVGFRPYRPY